MRKVIRYIGSKEKLLSFLSEVIFDKYRNIKILDGFTGTTVVSKYLQENTNFDLYLSDISDYSEILSSRLFLSKCNENIFNHISKIIQFSTENNPLEIGGGTFFNEFSIGGKPQTITEDRFATQDYKSRMFFTTDVGLKIDIMRSYIKKLFDNDEINIYEKNLLLMLVVSFADKNANTTSVYGAYLKNQNRKTKPLDHKFLNILAAEHKQQYKAPIQYLKGDILDTLSAIPELDVIYLDPPYNTRRYESNYHILNYLCNLNFSADEIKQNSKTGLPINSPKNMFSSKSNTPIVFENMIVDAMHKTKDLFISYSTDGEISFEQLDDICNRNNLKLSAYTKDYKKYTSHNNNKDKELKEIIYRIGK